MLHWKKLIVFTRYPEPGAVKSRLIPAMGPRQAAELHRDMTGRTITVARNARLGCSFDLEIHFEGGDKAGMQALYGDDLEYVTQSGSDLGERMRTSIVSVLKSEAEAAVLVGTDCPGITEAILRQAFCALEEADCVLGPAIDGGYYLIGMKRDIPEVFSSMHWGTGTVRARTLGVLKRMGLNTVLLDELHDVDRPEDLHVWDEMQRILAAPMISVVIPVLNEGSGVSHTIKKALAGRNIEVIVVDGGSTDDTVLVAQRAGARVIQAGRGRAVQMNAGASASSGDVLLFLHADTMLPSRYDDKVRAAMGDGRAVAGAFSLTFDNGRPALGVIAFGANLRSRILGMPYGDQAIFVKKDVFQRTGGFPEVPIMEDVIFMKSIKNHGTFAILRDCVITSGRRYLSMGPLRTWMLNQLAVAGYAWGIPLEDIAVLYRSRQPSFRIWAKHMARAWNQRSST